MTIRPMEEKDIPEVYEIEKYSFSDLWSEDSYMNFQSEKGQQYFVAEINQKIVAYCVTMIVLDECEILKVAVAKEFRRNGIGEELLSSVIKCYKEKAARFFYLEVRESNTSAINLYKKLGFSETRRRNDYYRHPTEAAVLMSYVI